MHASGETGTIGHGLSHEILILASCLTWPGDIVNGADDFSSGLLGSHISRTVTKHEELASTTL